MDSQAAWLLLDRGADALQLGGKGSQPVGFLKPDVGYISDSRSSTGEAGGCCQRHDAIAHAAHVDVNAAQRPARDRDAVASAGHRAAHFFEDIDEANVS